MWASKCQGAIPVEIPTHYVGLALHPAATKIRHRRRNFGSRAVPSTQQITAHILSFDSRTCPRAQLLRPKMVNSHL